MNESGRKYIKTIYSIDNCDSINVDVYAVLKAFNVTCPARAHAIKKLMCAGDRDKGDVHQDLREAEDAINRARQLAEYNEPHTQL